MGYDVRKGVSVVSRCPVEAFLTRSHCSKEEARATKECIVFLNIKFTTSVLLFFVQIDYFQFFWSVQIFNQQVSQLRFCVWISFDHIMRISPLHTMLQRVVLKPDQSWRFSFWSAFFRKKTPLKYFIHHTTRWHFSFLQNSPRWTLVAHQTRKSE